MLRDSPRKPLSEQREPCDPPSSRHDVHFGTWGVSGGSIRGTARRHLSGAGGWGGRAVDRSSSIWALGSIGIQCWWYMRYMDSRVGFDIVDSRKINCCNWRRGAVVVILLCFVLGVGCDVLLQKWRRRRPFEIHESLRHQSTGLTAFPVGIFPSPHLLLLCFALQHLTDEQLQIILLFNMLLLKPT